MNSPTKGEDAPSAYPRTYKPSRSDLVTYTLVGGMLVFWGLLGIVFPHLLRETKAAATAALIVAVSLGIYLLTKAAGAELILHTDSIELKSIYSSRELRKVDILGRRAVSTRAGQMLVLIPRQPDQRKLAIPTFFEKDEAFHEWLDDIPDLDAKEFAKSKSSMRRAASAKGIKGARRTVTLFNWITGAAVGGLVLGWLIDLFYPFPHQLVFVPFAVIPLIALGITIKSRKLYRLSAADTDARETLIFPIVILGAILGFLAMGGPQLLDERFVFLISVILSLILGATVILTDPVPYPRTGPILTLAMCTVLYFFGLIAEIDVLWDRSSPQTFQALVEGKHESHTRNTNYSHLWVGPWGPETSSNRLDVPQSLYDSVRPGQTVTVDLHPGALKLPWVSVYPGK